MVKALFYQASVVAALVAAVQGAATTPRVRSLHQYRQTSWPQSLAGEIYDQSWPEFAEKTLRWSTYEAPTFDSIFIPQNEQDLATGLSFMSSSNISFLAGKTSGHGYSPTLSIIQNGVMINMEKFNVARMNDDMTATVGGGVNFNDLVQVVGGAGRELNVGSCPCVGATGAMLGGGVGRLQGVRGLTIDAVRKVRMALWNGTIVEASDEANPDLFWAMRGAGNNFGVVVETTYETWPATNGGQHYQADMTYGLDSTEQLVETMNSLLPLDPALSLIVIEGFNSETAEPVLALNLVYAGSQEEGQKFAEPFKPFSQTLTEGMIPWTDLPTKSAGGAVLAKCVDGQRHNMYGSVARVLDPKDIASMFNEFADLVKANPAANASTILLETFGQQAVDAQPDESTAFPHRGYLANFVETEIAYVDDSVADVGDEFAKRWRDFYLEPANSGYTGQHVYQNYAHDDEPPSVLYGTAQWRQERLTALKQQYDPRGLFNAYHPVPATLAAWH